MNNIIVISRNPIGQAIHKVLSVLMKEACVTYADECNSPPQGPTTYILAGVDFKQAICNIATFRQQNRVWQGMIYYYGFAPRNEKFAGTPFDVFPNHHKLLPVPADLRDFINELNTASNSVAAMIDSRSQTYFRLISDAGDGPISVRDMVGALDHSLGHLEEDYRRKESPGLSWFKTVKHIAALLQWDGRFTDAETISLAKLEYDQLQNDLEQWIDKIRNIVKRLEQENG